MSKNKSVFSVLSSIDVRPQIKQKNGFDYLPWAWAWGQVMMTYPDSSYEFLGYKEDADLGYMVATSVTIGGHTLTMELPVLDGANKSMKSEEYSYKSYGKIKTVAKATMFDINKAQMRCLVKNLAMHGLGINVYGGEEFQSDSQDSVAPAPEKASASGKKKVTAETWKLIASYAAENKGLGLDKILKNISERYELQPKVVGQLKKIVDE